MNKKKLLAMMMSVALIGAIGVGATLAYFTDSETATNVVTMGNVDIDLDEPGFDNDDDKKDNKIENITPGEVITKDPTITVKESSQAAYVRATVTFKGLTYKQQNELIEKIQFCMGEEDESPLWNIITNVSMSEDDLSMDDWDVELVCYYKNVVEPGQSVVLFDEVIVPETWGNEVADKTFEIVVKGEAIQADNFTPAKDADGNIIGWNYSDGTAITVENYDEEQLEG